MKAISIFDKVIWWSLSLENVSCLFFFSLFIFFSEVVWRKIVVRFFTIYFIFVQVLKEEPTYPEALIGRGTAYAFQRELESAIADFTKVFIYLTRVVTTVG